MRWIHITDNFIFFNFYVLTYGLRNTNFDVNIASPISPREHPVSSPLNPVLDRRSRHATPAEASFCYQTQYPNRGYVIARTFRPGTDISSSAATLEDVETEFVRVRRARRPRTSETIDPEKETARGICRSKKCDKLVICCGEVIVLGVSINSRATEIRQS